MPDVYIAHALKDIAFARRLDRALKEKGLETWAYYKDSPEDMAMARQALKERGLDRSMDFDEIYEDLAFVRRLTEIAYTIQVTDSFIFIVSRDSVRSRACRKELGIALEDAKRIIPIVIDRTDYEKAIPELARSNRLEFCDQGRFEQNLQELLEAIQRD